MPLQWSVALSRDRRRLAISTLSGSSVARRSPTTWIPPRGGAC